MPFLGPIGAAIKSIFRMPYTWVVVIAATLGQGGSNSPFQALPVLFPFMQEDLGLTRTQLGVFISLMVGGGTSTILIGGWLTDIWGVRKVTGYLLLALLPAMVVLGMSSAYWLLLLLAVVIGMIQSPGFLSTSRAILDWLPPRGRALAMGIKQTGTPMVGVLAAAALPALAVTLGWRNAVFMVAGAMFIAGIVFLLIYRDKPSEAHSRRESLFGGLRDVIANRTLLLITTWSTLFSIASIVVSTYLVLFLVEEPLLSPVAAGGIIAVARVGSVVGRVLWGAVSDLLFCSRRIIVLGIVGISCGLAFIGIAFVHEGTSIWVIGLFSFALGLTALSWRTVHVVLIGELASPHRMGVVMGTTSTIASIGSLVGTPIFGLIVDNTESYALAWGATATVALGSTALLLLLGREPKRDGLQGQGLHAST
jgi:ACS family hexuronate transporter-like MFS transporter